jgi:hypothetical protein
VEVTRSEYEGWVTHLTRDSLTIQKPGGFGWRQVSTSRGRVVFEARWDIVYSESRTFRASAVLAAGEFPTDGHAERMPSYSYRLTDVRLRDKVCIGYTQLEGVDICIDIRIDRRPGGLVPPAPGEHPKRREDRKHHVGCNEFEKYLSGKKPYPDGWSDTPRPLCEGMDEYGSADAPMKRLYPDGPWYIRLIIPPWDENWPDQPHDKK